MKTKTTDYRLLLLKYMNLVGEQEGVTFVSNAGDNSLSKFPFSAEEISELEKIEEEL